MLQKVMNGVLLGFTFLMTIISAVELDNEGKTTDSAAKKAQAVQLIQQNIDPALPAFLQPVFNVMAPGLIDLLVAVANRTGFFKQSSVVSTASSASS